MSTRPPRVALFRPSPIASDSRAKKLALTLARVGYDVVVLTPVPPGVPTRPQRLGPVVVQPVTLATTHRDEAMAELVRRRTEPVPVFSRLSTEAYLERLQESRTEVRRAVAKAQRHGTASGAPRPTPKYAAARAIAEARKAEVRVLRARQELQAKVNRRAKRWWRIWDQFRLRNTLLAADHRVMPELADYAEAFGPILEQLAPDVLHAHHPTVLPVATAVARTSAARGKPMKVVYDARENFAGIPEGEQGNMRRHHVLVRQEAEHIREAAAVVTVSAPIAAELQSRYGLPAMPSVVLNLPILRRSRGTGPTIRDAAGAGDAPLIVYSGGISRARGVETLVDAMPELPAVVLALVTVPFPHPSVPALLERAAALGVDDRVRVLAPVGQDELLHFLSGADVGVHPMPSGSPNHDMALPNKLFEYLHAGLELAVSDARMMAAFVDQHDLGTVFPTGDPHGLALAVKAALLRSRTRDRTSRHALARRFSWQGQEDDVAALYARVAPLPGGRRRPVEDFPALDVADVELPEAAIDVASDAPPEHSPDLVPEGAVDDAVPARVAGAEG